ncbi:hypothetical protein BC477_11070 [Clavibacter michiganensis subsp. michiganensis]|uniref:Uncharacterized protein n=1 Tax=Clavibacter michiganensis subsp. michiganensis TaxID=33013 RepID=A0A251XGY4_CLAMM|nr:hypothetical protein BC477_11070 [Clavibacter michiganensis subsp. michiganensis]OUE02335.1 hypothetical protein CMMCAS07_09985 [Clavibacter michiganensis subsp. michiganensis]
MSSSGARTALPACTARIAAARKAGVASLSRKPLAPPRMAVADARSSANVVSTITRGGASRVPSKSARTVSRPSITGMRMSRSTTSGRTSSITASPCRPSPASPTTSRSGWASRATRTPPRNSSWSSTSTMRITGGLPARWGWGARPAGGCGRGR